MLYFLTFYIFSKYYREGGDPTPALKAIYGDSAAAKSSTAAAATTAAPTAAAAAPDLGTVTVNGVEYKKYPTPDTRFDSFRK